MNTPKPKLEAAYIETLAELAPKPKLIRLFKTVVLGAYRTRQADARRQVVETERRLAQIEKRKARLEEAYLFEKTLDRGAYMRHTDRLSEERALALLARHEAEVDGFDVEALVNYAEYLALNPGPLWLEANPEQKARLQRFLVPSGLTWDGERFGTVVTGLFFGRLDPVTGETKSMVALRGFEPRFDG